MYNGDMLFFLVEFGVIRLILGWIQVGKVNLE